MKFPKVYKKEKDGTETEVPRKYTTPMFVVLMAVFVRGVFAFVDDLAGKKK